MHTPAHLGTGRHGVNLKILISSNKLLTKFHTRSCGGSIQETTNQPISRLGKVLLHIYRLKLINKPVLL